MNAYLASVLENVRTKHGNEPEFVQTVEEVFSSIEPVIEKHPEYEKVDLLGRMVEPERMFTFRVVWCDDNGQWHTNRGWRCQFNGAIGPYKGGLRFQKNVYEGIIKFLGFEQTFKNSLTGLPIGGAKGGSDFDPAGKSDAEVMRFCQSFMTELQRHIGYGAVYYLQEVLKHEGDTIEGKRIALSGYGNVAWGIMKKAAELGAKVTYMSGPDGYVHDPDGINTEEKLNFILEMRAKDPMHCKPYADRFGCEFVAGAKHWGATDVDVNMPSAMQNDVRMDSAEKIAASGVKYYIEVANMPTTNDALNFLRAQKHMIVAPSKAVNAGGVGVSALEMAQNSERLVWTAEEVDAQLHKMMKTIHQVSAEAAEEYGLGYDLVAGANIAGFKKVAEAMMAQGCF